MGGNFVPPQGSGPSGGGGQPMRMHHQTIQVTTTQGPAQPTPTSTPPGPPGDMKPGSHMQPQPPQMSQGNMDMGKLPPKFCIIFESTKVKLVVNMYLLCIFYNKTYILLYKM